MNASKLVYLCGQKQTTVDTKAGDVIASKWLRVAAGAAASSNFHPATHLNCHDVVSLLVMQGTNLLVAPVPRHAEASPNRNPFEKSQKSVVNSLLKFCVQALYAP